MSDQSQDEHTTEGVDPTDLRFVGPATADVLAESDLDARAIADKRVTYRDLVDAGVNPGVAARIRREHSLSWSTTADGDDLERRSSQIRGLGDAERAWVAASSGEWEDTEEDTTAQTAGDGSGTTSGDSGDAAGVDAYTPGDWNLDSDADTAETDGSGDHEAAESAWRARSKPTPVTEIDGVAAADATALAEAGVTSIRSLATCDPEHVSDALGLDQSVVQEWHRAARALDE